MTSTKSATESLITHQKLPWFPWIGKKRPFYGWIIVAVGTLVWSANNLQAQSFPTYLPLLQKEFGWSRAVMAGPRSITQLESALLGPLEGFLVDKFGPRTMIVIGLLIMGFGLILFGLIQSLWMFFAVSVVIALGFSLASPFIVSVAVNHWFRRRRSTNTSIVGLGYGVATVLGVPAVIFLQDGPGWRTATILTGLLAWFVAIPAALFIRRSPEPYGLHMDGDTPGATSSATSEGGSGRSPTAEEYDFTLRQALRTRAFWFIVVGQAVASLGMSSVPVHLFLHLEQGVGLSPTTGALIVSVTGMSNVVARLFGGYLGDRLPKHIVLGSTVSLVGIAVLVLAFASSLPMALAYAVFYGAGVGARTPVLMSMEGEYFGRRSQGIIRGCLAALNAPVGLLAPVAIGYIADRQGDYRMVFTVIAFLMMAGTVFFFLAIPPKPPVQKEAIFG